MGVRVEIGGEVYDAESYSVLEDSTPTSSDDSSGSVGVITFTIPGVKNAFLLAGKEISLKDTRRGSTVGFVDQVSESDRGSTVLTCQSRLGRLNIFGVQSQPFEGTLQDAFRYYVGLAGQTTEILVDPEIASRPVVFPGWFGELWFHMKQMAAAQDCELALVSDVILLRPLRTREAVNHRDISRNRAYGGTSLARSVEVYCYDNRPIREEMVYPIVAWSPEVEVITVGAGETVERTLELSSSVSSIQDPVMQTFVSQDYKASSVYTVVGDDGLPIQPGQWRAAGGRMEVRILEDTRSLLVTFTGASGIQSAKGQPISTYSLALGSDFTGNRYSTLRIVGDGVGFRKESVFVRTGVPSELTATEVGITIDNPFISTWDDAYKAGVKSAKWYAGEKMVLGGSVTSINQLGDSGAANYPTYAFDQSQWQGSTYGQVQTSNGSRTYRDIEESYYDIVRSDFDNQVFGNSGGARVWDETSRRWYRIRTATTDPSNISYEAVDDLTHLDVESYYQGLTYSQERSLFPRRTYSERDRLGLTGRNPGDKRPLLYPSTSLYPSTELYPVGDFN